jgi:hypothetical protein
MRANSASRIDAVSPGAIEYLGLGWLQAGFVSSAYRLAHLRSNRSLVLFGLSFVFFLN